MFYRVAQSRMLLSLVGLAILAAIVLAVYALF